MRSYHFAFLFLLPCFVSCQQVQEQAFSGIPAVMGQAKGEPTPTTSNIVFQSTDGGQHWQDISAGLPKGFEPTMLFANNGELYLGAEQGVYRNGNASKSGAWEKDMTLTEPYTTFSDGPGGIIAYSQSRVFQKLYNSDLWMPIFKDFKGQNIRLVFTAKNGSLFICSDNGIYKSTDQGKTWQHVMQQGWVIEMVESDGVLLCTNQQGILRSTDGGENWEVVLSEGGVGIAVEVIEGGFASIVYNTKSETRRVRISTDGGKTWQAIDEGLPPSMLISSIKQVGNDFYCGHPKGIYRSVDGGKTWQLLIPTIGDKVFDLSVSGEVVYAILKNGGC